MRDQKGGYKDIEDRDINYGDEDIEAVRAEDFGRRIRCDAEAAQAASSRRRILCVGAGFRRRGAAAERQDGELSKRSLFSLF